MGGRVGKWIKSQNFNFSHIGPNRKRNFAKKCSLPKLPRGEAGGRLATGSGRP